MDTDVQSRRLIFNDFRLVTAEILYHMPDHPHVLQSYLWQDYDELPRFPILGKFLRFWTRELDGPLHSVTVSAKNLIQPARFEARDVEILIH